MRWQGPEKGHYWGVQCGNICRWAHETTIMARRRKYLENGSEEQGIKKQERGEKGENWNGKSAKDKEKQEERKEDKAKKKN